MRPIFTQEAIAAGLPGAVCNRLSDRECPGFRPLREGEAWHRNDFTPAMLPLGYRPLLAREETPSVHHDVISRDQYCLRGDTHWVSIIIDSIPEGWNQHGPYYFLRTARPLPE